MKKINSLFLVLGLLSAVLFVLAVGLAYKLTASGTTQTTNKTTYFCEQGQLGATFAKETLVLQFPDGHAETLKQMPTGSGMNYQSGQTTFTGKGSDASVTQGSSTTFGNCVSGTVHQTAGTKTYTDANKSYSIAYPSTLTLSGGGGGYTESWRKNAGTSGMLLAKIAIPASLQPKTNFAGGQLTIGMSMDPQALKSCVTPAQGEEAQANVELGSSSFSVFASSDFGAGNSVQTLSYRSVHAGACYALETNIHSMNLGNFGPEQSVVAFDQAQVQDMMSKMVKSFHFLP